MSWVDLRISLWKIEYRIAAFTYPIIGQYIIALDNSILGEARFEIKMIYLAFLIIALLIIFFPKLCPSIFLKYKSKDEFVDGYPEDDYSLAKLKELEVNLDIFDGSGDVDWKCRLSTCWDTAIQAKSSQKTIMKSCLNLSVFMLAISSAISVFRVLRAIIF